MTEFKGYSSPTHFILSSTPPPDTDDSENWFSSPTSTNGRSSISSIPWAEDAIQQNQDEWEQIERIFYGEEPLPTESKLRQEFLDWMTLFPHIRVSGEQIPLHYDCCTTPSDESYEEIIAIDPPQPQHFQSNLMVGGGRHRNTPNAITRKENDSNMPINRRLSAIDHFQLDKCIRITSGPTMSRNRNNFLHTKPTPEQYNPSLYYNSATDQQRKRFNQARTKTAIKELSPLRIASVKSDFCSRKQIAQPITNLRNTIYMESLSRPVTLSSNSLLKMPPILSVRSIQSRASAIPRSDNVLRQRPLELPPLSTSTALSRKSRVSLPTITPLVTTGQRFIFERSISAFSKKPNLVTINDDDSEFGRKLSNLNVGG